MRGLSVLAASILWAGLAAPASAQFIDIAIELLMFKECGNVLTSWNSPDHTYLGAGQPIKRMNVIRMYIIIQKNMETGRNLICLYQSIQEVIYYHLWPVVRFIRPCDYRMMQGSGKLHYSFRIVLRPVS
jgi:hypothetical protein